MPADLRVNMDLANERRAIPASIDIIHTSFISKLYSDRSPQMATPYVTGSQGPNKAIGPLRVDPRNPRYLNDGKGAVYLAGMHDGWEVQDNAYEDQDEIIFDFDSFLKDLSSKNLNLMRLWTVEHSRAGDKTSHLTWPTPYKRVAGRGTARDGQLRFDLTQFNPDFSRRLVQRAMAAQSHGIYCLVMLFCGLSDWGSESINTSAYHPYAQGNNIQGLNADLDGDGRVKEVHAWQGEDHWLTQLQRAYVRHLIDELNELDNIIWEICNECPMAYSKEWQYQMVGWIHRYESDFKPKQHPVLLSGGPDGANNLSLFSSPAECIAPDSDGGTLYREHIPETDGAKVVILDTDHIFGYNLEDPRWVWRAFTRGYNPLYMDRWTQDRLNPERERVRRALGHTRLFASHLNMEVMSPREDLASTRFCLANPGHQYLVFSPRDEQAVVSVQVSPGCYDYEWFDANLGLTASSGRITTVGGQESFTSPVTGDAVLFLKSTS
jgi:hypothetical protein